MLRDADIATIMARPSSMLGRRVLREFEDCSLIGHVVFVRVAHAYGFLFGIQYDNDHEEELTCSQLRELLLPA